MQTKRHIALIQWQSFRLKIFFEGILVGLFGGVLVVTFRYLLEKAELLREHIYIVLHVNGSWATVLWLIALMLVSVCLGFIAYKVPMAGGSGIPQVKGIILGHFKMNWLKIIIGKFLGGILAIGSGLSLGREGPSIQLGAMAGQGVSRLLGRLRVEEKYLITSGASAGLAAAFNAPLAGVIFALEELHKNFSPAVLMSAMAASLTADLITQQVFGQKPVFDFRDLAVLPHNYYIYVVGLGVICGFLGFLFNWTLTKTLDAYKKITWLPKMFMSAPALILGGILGFVLPEVLGGGNKLIDSIGQTNYGIAILLIFFAVKFLYTMISYGSGVPGGIFMPMLVIGALAGAIYGDVLIVYFHIDQKFFSNFIVLAMAAYFTAIVKAPVTGSILITEMTGSFDHLLALIIASVTAYVVSDILKTAPIYDTLLARSLVKKNRNIYSGWDNKTLIEVAVCLGSKLEGKRIMDIVWPPHCLLISIKRSEAEIIPRGNTKIIVGDYLFALANENESADIKEALSLMAGITQTME